MLKPQRIGRSYWPELIGGLLISSGEIGMVSLVWIICLKKLSL